MNNQAAQTMHDAAQEVVRAYFADELDDTMILNLSAALAQTAGVVEGWKLVPIKPTPSMLEAAFDKTGPYPSLSDYWNAMLSAAPTARKTATVVVSDEMVERACKKYAFREDGALWPDAYSEHEVIAERTLMREFLEHVLAAAPAASGGEDVHRVTDAQIADIVLRWEANQFDSFSAMRAIKQHLEKCALQPANDYNLGWVAGHRAAPQPPAGASVSERARALLAAEYERGGREGAYPTYAEMARNGRGEFTKCALRALEQALTQQRGWAEGDADPTAKELAITALRVAIDSSGGTRVTMHKTRAKQALAALTTPQPGTETLREGLTDEDVAVLRRLKAALPTVGLNGWMTGVRVLGKLESLLARGA